MILDTRPQIVRKKYRVREETHYNAAHAHGSLRTTLCLTLAGRV